MERQLLIDTMAFEPRREALNEALAGNGPFIVKGILQRSDVKNQNGRVYPHNTLLREVQKYIDTFVKDRHALGELDHPESQVVNLKNTSHNIREVHWEGKDLVGAIEVLSTPSGNILKELFRSNIRLGISSRGLGTIRKVSEGLDQVQDDFSLIAFDFVSNPSVMGAFMAPEQAANLNEGVIVPAQIVDNKWVMTETLIQNIFNELS